MRIDGLAHILPATADEAVNFINLNSFAGKIAKMGILIFETGFSGIDQELQDRVERHIGKTGGGPDRVSFNKKIQDFRLLCDTLSVHYGIVLWLYLSGQARKFWAQIIESG